MTKTELGFSEMRRKAQRDGSLRAGTEEFHRFVGRDARPNNRMEQSAKRDLRQFIRRVVRR